ncbi:MAG: glucose-1-phosphate adenylyltransferase [Omnitrophica WOR_2 bacterium SM23_29]|nr:MAG: glucose-1-phosphate adenylyltransferase [Omnitrophica WOR_2 bacterium SM23_29]
MRDIVTFIMAGGKGERLYPLTKDRAKPAVPFGGIYRIIDVTLSNCINSGIRKIHVLIQYKCNSLIRHLRMGWHIFDAQLGEYIDIVPAQMRVDERWYTGTADSVFQNLYSIEIDRPKYVLILAGDHIYKMNYAEMVDFHVSKKADCTVAVVEVDKEKANLFGVVEVDGKNKILGFEEKPKVPKTIKGDPNHVYASMGIYVFNCSILQETLISDAKDKDSGHDFGKDVLPRLIKTATVYAYNFKDENKKEAKYWRDIGTLDAYYEANMDLVRVTPVFNLYDKDWPLRTSTEQTPPAKFVFAGGEDGKRIGVALDSMVSSGCIISGGKVERSVLSPHVRVNSYAEVLDSVVMEGVDIGRYAKIRRAIIDKDVKIPQGTRIGYDLKEDKKRFTVTDSGIAVVAKGTVIEG